MSADLTTTPFTFGDYRVEPEQNLVRCGETLLSVEKRNMDLLTYLVMHRDRVVSADELLEQLWKGRVVEESTIHRRISQLRKLLGDSARTPRYIKTVSKRGYQAIAETGMPVTRGRIIKGRFVLQGEPLSETEHGVVYRALDLRQQEGGVSNPYVAIKLLGREEQAQLEGLQLTEITSRNRELAHRNIMNVFDFDRDGELVYLTMPLLEGLPLDRYLATQQLAFDDAVKVILDCCEALKFTHDHGAIHGAFRPGVIFYTADRISKVFDFGVPPADQSNLHGSGISDPSAYASPAVLGGDPPGVADDIFSLGVVAWELLTGTHPFLYQPAGIAAEKALQPAAGRALPEDPAVLLQAMSFERDKRPADVQLLLEYVRALGV